MFYAFPLALYPFLLGYVQSAKMPAYSFSRVIILAWIIIQINYFHFVISFGSLHSVLACAMSMKSLVLWENPKIPVSVLSVLWITAFVKRKEKRSLPLFLKNCSSPVLLVLLEVILPLLSNYIWTSGNKHCTVTPSSCNPLKGTQKRIQISAGHNTIDTENILTVKNLFKRQGREEFRFVMEEEDEDPQLSKEQAANSQVQNGFQAGQVVKYIKSVEEVRVQENEGKLVTKGWHIFWGAERRKDWHTQKWKEDCR